MKSSKLHCKYCFDSLVARLKKGKLPHPSFSKSQSAPLFVTWKKSSEQVNTDDLSELEQLKPESYILRGCIGTFSDLKLIDALGRYAVIAATEDTRFAPIVIEELPLLEVCVSLLIKFKKQKSVFDWEVGVHGILIDFSVGNNSYNGTFLPEVALEQGWNQMETLKSLIHKAGYYGEVDDGFYNSINLTTYESSKCSLRYAEWKQM